MLETQDLENEVRDLIVEVCTVLYRRGYRTVSVGAMMRLVGVDSAAAAQHDLEYFELGDEFQNLAAGSGVPDSARIPPDATVH